jgi:DNA-binding NtrC family response regulator
MVSRPTATPFFKSRTRSISSLARSAECWHLLHMHKHHTILLVEDDTDVRWLIATALRRLGYDVIEASSLADACARFGDAGSAIGLLLSDVLLSDGTGPDLYRLLVTIEPSLRLLLTTGASESSLLGLVGDGPVTDFIVRPFSLDALAEKVGDIFTVRADGARAPVRSRISGASSDAR